MTIDSIIYTKDNIKSLNMKKCIMIAYTVLFGLLLASSVTIFTFLFIYSKKDILSFLLCGFSIMICSLYIVANVMNIKKIIILNKNLLTKEKYEQTLKEPLKINEKSKLSTSAIVFIVCVSLILIATVASFVFLCLDFSFEILAETLFMVLILGYSSQTLITTLFEDRIYKNQINNVKNK